jgi:hypothetical protein
MNSLAAQFQAKANRHGLGRRFASEIVINTRSAVPPAQ